MLLSSVWLQIQTSDQNNQLSPLNKQRLAHVIMMNVKNRNMVSKYNEYFGQFTCDENQEQQIQEMLAAKGFQVIAHYGMDGEKFDKHTTQSILTVARKK